MIDPIGNGGDALSVMRLEHRALAILRILNRMPGYGANDRLLGNMLQLMGLSGSQAETASQLDELQAKGLVRLARVEKLTTVHLTANGAEAAEGLIAVEGVLPPRPECPY